MLHGEQRNLVTGNRVVATVHADDHFDGLAVNLGVGVKVTISAEFFHEIDGGLDSFAGGRYREVLGTDSHGDL